MARKNRAKLISVSIVHLNGGSTPTGRLHGVGEGHSVTLSTWPIRHDLHRNVQSTANPWTHRTNVIKGRKIWPTVCHELKVLLF